MKKTLIIALSILMLAGLSSIAMAAGAGAGIAGSPHDFSARAWNNGGAGEICVVCHTPHNAQNTQGLIWNHAFSAATYTMYDSTISSTLDGVVDPQPSGIAKLCLSCHDGTVAIDAFGGGAGGAEMIPAYAEIPAQLDGTNEDLRATHPVSITYNDAVDIGLNVAAVTPIGTSGFISDVLDAGKVQCSSCHDVHDRESVSGTALLRVSNVGSALCLTCHYK